MAALALSLAITISVLSPERTIFWFVIFGWSGIAATFCPMITLSLFWSGFAERAVIASMVAGFSMTIVSKFVLQELEVAGPYFAALETMPPSFLFALLVGWLVSLAWPTESLRALYRADLDDLISPSGFCNLSRLPVKFPDYLPLYGLATRSASAGSIPVGGVGM